MIAAVVQRTALRLLYLACRYMIQQPIMYNIAAAINTQAIGAQSHGLPGVGP